MKKELSGEDIGIEELVKIGKFMQSEILERKEAENKKVVNDLEKKLRDISLEELANHIEESYDDGKYYYPYLFNFGYILERLKEEEKKNVSVESLKIKKDLIEQLIIKMKKYPSFDTVCHIESVKRSSEFKYWLLRHLLKNKKYKIIFHNKKIKLEDTFYEKDASNLKAYLLAPTFVFTLALLVINICWLFKIKIFVMLFLIFLISLFTMIFAWC